MTLWVHATGAYRADTTSGWRGADFNVRNLVKALKGETFRGYSNLQFERKNYTFTAADTAPAYGIWSAWAASVLRDLKLGKVTLVPVPSSGQVKYGQDTCPVRMANSVATLDPKLASVGHFLRHKTAQQRAHKEGGSRNQAVIEAALDCKVTDKSRPVVLIDDVKTTGSHLLAAARTLREHGVTVEHAMVAGRAVWQAVPEPYKVAPEDLEENPFEDLTL
jgi:hypothetical protein